MRHGYCKLNKTAFPKDRFPKVELLKDMHCIKIEKDLS